MVTHSKFKGGRIPEKGKSVYQGCAKVICEEQMWIVWSQQFGKSKKTELLKCRLDSFKDIKITALDSFNPSPCCCCQLTN